MMIDELNKENWTEIYTLDDPNESYNSFQEKLTHVYNKAFPLKVYRIKENKLNNKPWLTKGLLRSLKKKRQPIQKVNQDSDS